MAVGFAVALAAVLLARSGVASDAIEVREAPLVRTLQFSGRVATLSRVDVGSTVTGRVRQVLVREGDRVEAGQPLVRLESEQTRAALAQAMANERQAQARLQGLRGSERRAAAAQLDQAEANLSAARSELSRAQQLVAQGFVSASRVDEARRALEVAQAQRDAAAAQLQARSGQGAELAQAQAQLAAARAAIEAAQARLAEDTVVAPTPARVLTRLVEPGQIVQPGRALLGLALAGPTQVVAQVDEAFLQQLRTGQPASVLADAFPERRMAARVLSIAPSVDAQRGAVEVKLALQGDPPDFLREDMTLSVEVITGRRDRALVIPARALRPADSGGDSVLVQDAGRAVARPVRTGLRTLDAVEVLEGLREGEQVLLAPALQAGDRVRATVIDWAPARSGAAIEAALSSDPMSSLSQGVGR
ncbi:efflux RND transporter periplasmic adaptor subunit [Ramlibacter sp.]|uniref:efflux RND transporter periplasmic adaptor subunit n=1 Tax=Ramlibacter sp. TaxID=1917967 RepID=UPI002D452E33|nr:efflux RND transporter periplasmic adaptor subunit [Ramlibacter sp.]HYD75953.1 efflux RND transporter periplasmic adaptor subunit [Ramlibacter sp.]